MGERGWNLRAKIHLDENHQLIREDVIGRRTFRAFRSRYPTAKDILRNHHARAILAERLQYAPFCATLCDRDVREFAAALNEWEVASEDTPSGLFTLCALANFFAHYCAANLIRDVGAELLRLKNRFLLCVIERFPNCVVFCDDESLPKHVVVSLSVGRGGYHIPRRLVRRTTAYRQWFST